MWLTVLYACVSSCGPAPDAPPPVPVPAPAAGAPEPAWSLADCVASELALEVTDLQPDAEGVRVLRRDLDGDGNPDHAELRAEGAAVALHVRMSRDPHRLRLRYEPDPDAPFTRVPVPEGWSASDRGAVEELLWPLRCARPDPTLAASLEPEVVRWFEGAPSIPPPYVVDRGSEWIVARGAEGVDPGWRELATAGGAVLRAGRFGVVAERSGTHAWLLVTPGADPLGFSGSFVEPDLVELVGAPLGAAPGADAPALRRRL
jgi:hypothetical protein